MGTFLAVDTAFLLTSIVLGFAVSNDYFIVSLALLFLLIVDLLRLFGLDEAKAWKGR